MAPRTLTVFSPPIGDVVLNAALLNEILGGAGGSIISTLITTVGAGVLSAAGLVGGQIGRTGPVAAYTDTTATAAAIVAALGGFQLGQTFETRIKNATAFVQTLQGGTGVTLPATAIVPPLCAGNYFGTVGGTAAAPTVTFIHEETVPIYAAARISDEQASALNTVGAGTILAASMNAGVTTRGGVQIAAFADTLDTGPNIIAGVSALSAVIGSAVEWTYANNTIFPATLGGASGSSIVGATVVPANSWAKYLITYTAAGTVVLTCIGQGYFPKVGVTAAANGATPVAVVDAAVTANSIITLSLKTAGGTPHGAFVSSVTPGTGFSINSLAGDTSTYTYEIRG